MENDLNNSRQQFRARLSPKVRILRLLRVLAITGLALTLPVITYLSLEPQFAPPNEYGLDKFVHIATFAFLAALSVVAFPRGRIAAIALAFLALFGAGIEIGQSFIPGRQGSFWDFAGDLLGIALGFALMQLVDRFVSVAPRLKG